MRPVLKRQDLFCIGTLLLFCGIAFSRLLCTGVTLYARDISQYYRPMYFLAAESIQRGIFPFWNPYVSCGQPFFAALQHGLLYPVSVLVFLFPFEWAFKYIYVFHFMFAGLGIYILLRQLALHPVASLSGAVIFIFSGVMASIINLLTTLAALSWLSYVFSFFFSAQERKVNWPWIVLLALALSMQFYAGQPEVMYMSMAAIMVFAIVTTRGAGYLNVAKILILVLGLLALFILIELVPFLQLLKLSHRESFSNFSTQTVWSFHPWQLIDLAIPSFLRHWLGTGSPILQEWLGNIYFGLSGIVLLFFSYHDRQLRRSWWAFLGIALLAVGISFGNYTPLYKFLTVIMPGLKAIRYPVKFLVLFNWCLAVLAAFGLNTLVREAYERTTLRPHLAKKLGLIYLILFAAVLFFARQGLWPDQYQLLGLLTILVLLLLALLFPRFNNSYIIPAIILVIFFTSAYFTAGREKLTSISGIRHKGEFKRIIDTLGMARFSFTPKTQAVITGADKDAPSYMNTYKSADLSIWESVPNMAMVGHEFVAKGYESIYLDRFFSLYGLTSYQKGPSGSRILDLLGVKYVVSLWDIKDANFSLLKENGWRIYVNRQAWPRVFTTEDKVKADTLIEALQQMQGEYTRQTVPKIITYDLHKVVIAVDLPRAGNLVLTDTYYPGWTATIDGKEAAIFPAYYIVRGISVPPGQHTVVFSYRPDNFAWAALISVSAVIICLFCFIHYIKLRIK
ncbi:MAG: YfhO family protein [bacterium]|nr:YfhO family protein [bacterium]